MIERRVRVTGIELSVAEAGAGGRPLLLAHGFTGAKEDFTPWLDALAAMGWHAVAPDHRGHGASDHPELEAEHTLGLVASDLLDLADELGWRRFTLLGHSMGGAIAQRLAFAAPERLDGLILMDTFHGPLQLDASVLQLAVDVVRAGGMAGYLDGLKALAASGDVPLGNPAEVALRERDPGYAAWQDRKVLATSPAAFVGFLNAMRREQERLGELVAKVRSAGVAVHVIVGEHDRDLVPEARRLAGAFGTRLDVIAGGGHCPQFEATDGWWSSLTSFLGTIAPRHDAGGAQP